MIMWLLRTARKAALAQGQARGAQPSALLSQAALVSVLVLVAYLDLEIMLTSVPEEDAQIVIDAYLKARSSGLNHSHIVKEIFKADFPPDVFVTARPQSYPFVTGDTFRALADVIYVLKDGEWNIRAKRKRTQMFLHMRVMRHGDVLFLECDPDSGNLRRFRDEILQTVYTNFILVTHNGDIFGGLTNPNTSEVVRWAVDDMLKDPRLLRWFAVAPTMTHPKLEAIPVGLRNAVQDPVNGGFEIYEEHIRSIPAMFDGSDTSSRPFLVYVGLGNADGEAAAVNETRVAEAVASLSAIPKEMILLKSEGENHLDLIKKAKFVLCPAGVQPDTHLVWESVLLGAIPIVTANAALADLHQHIPVYVHHDWSKMISVDDLLKFRPTVLNSSHSASRDAILAQHWFNIINKHREQYYST